VNIVSLDWIFIPQHDYTNVLGQKAALIKTLEKNKKSFSNLKKLPYKRKKFKINK
jgi:hypothetical protein